MDCNPPGSSVHGVFWSELNTGVKRILEWVVRPPPGDLPNPGIQPAHLLSPALAGGFFTTSSTQEAPYIYVCVYIYMYTHIYIYIHMYIYTHTQYVNPSPGGSDSKESSCNAGDLGSIPGLGSSPGGGHGNPLQYSCLENPWREEHVGLQSMGSQRVRHD